MIVTQHYNANIKAQMLTSFLKQLTALFKQVYRRAYVSNQLEILIRRPALVTNSIPAEFGMLPVAVLTEFFAA